MIAGVDVGYGRVKAYVKTDDGVIKCGYPRVLAEPRNMYWKELNRLHIYSIEGERYIVGDPALSFSGNIIRHESQDYVLENPYWICLGKALIDAGCFHHEGNPIRLNSLVLGIAPGHYQDDTIKKMKTRIRRGVEMYVDNREYRFSAESIQVLPQAAGAFFDWMLSDEGSIRDLKYTKYLFGVLDIGYRTTDYISFDGDRFVTDDSPSEDTGVRSVLSRLLEYVTKRYDCKDKNVEYLEPLLSGKPYLYRGDKIDLSSEVKKIVNDHFKRRIEPGLKKRWESVLDRMHKIIVCGGGAYLINSVNGFMKGHEKQIFIPDAPEYSNARGFYRFAAMNEKNN